ncbi:MAG: hypothetical protein ACE360_00570 [Hyphomicrobiales bacterium]
MQNPILASPSLDRGRTAPFRKIEAVFEGGFYGIALCVDFVKRPKEEEHGEFARK